MSSTWFPARSLLLLAAAGLWACSSDDSSGPSDPGDDELPEFTAGTTQLSPALRATIAGLLGDFGDASGLSTDPEAEGALAAAGAAFLGEGWITGVTASSASIRRGGGGGANVQASRVDGTWGVFGVAVAVYPTLESQVSAYYTGVVALKGNEAAIGIKAAHTEPEIQDARADFPEPKAWGLFFQGQSRGWGATDGYTQVIPKNITPCEETIPGVVCHEGTFSLGLEILESVPLPQLPGNQASGSREFLLNYGDVHGYYLAVYCDSSDYC